jgi:hypothetical protein
MTEHKEDISQPSRLSPRARLLLATGAILVLLPCLGLMGAGAYIRARRAGAFSRWRSLGQPPGTGVDIVTGDADVVYVRTATGLVYRCDHGETRAAEDCWDYAQEPLTVHSKARLGTSVYQGELEPPPGTVVDTLHVTIWYAEDAFETRYVLLEEGTVWMWQYDVGAYWTLSILLIGPAVGAAIGIVAVIVLWARAGLRSRRRRREQSPDEGM